jgi:hypothetical protein
VVCDQTQAVAEMIFQPPIPFPKLAAGKLATAAIPESSVLYAKPIRTSNGLRSSEPRSNQSSALLLMHTPGGFLSSW